MARVVIVVPCYNEERRLEAGRFENFLTTSDDVDFLFVNDGSRDGTLALLQRLVERHGGRMDVISLDRNSGKAEAVRRGVLAALERGPRFVGFWDADLATPLDDIPRFCRVLEQRRELRAVIGARLRLLGHNIERRRARALAGHLFAFAASAVLGVRFRDTQCGAKLLRVTPCLADLFADPFVSRWIFDVEMMVRLTRYRRDRVRGSLARLVYEFPLDEWRDIKGSKLLAGDFSKAAMDLARIYWMYLRPGADWRPSSHASTAAPAPATVAIHPAQPGVAGAHTPAEHRAPLAPAEHRAALASPEAESDSQADPDDERRAA